MPWIKHCATCSMRSSHRPSLCIKQNRCLGNRHYQGMSPTSIAINPLFPLVWANPQTLHIGFDPPRVILRNVEDDLLLLLHHLTSGVSESGLRMFAETSGVSDQRLQQLLITLAPVLSSTDPLEREEYQLDGPESLTTPTRVALTSFGHPSHLFDALTPSTQTRREVLIVAHFVPAPEQFTRWLRRDQPHTPIIFTDQAITVGPRIMPGEDACLHCEISTDPWMPWSHVAIVSQLWGRPAPTATAHNITRATWHASTMVSERGERYQLRISPTTGRHERREIAGRPGCGCREVT